MKSSFSRLVLPAFLSVTFFFMYCSLDNLAGGSGAGNPGGSVTVALRAEVTLGTAKRAYPDNSSPIFDTTTDTSINLTDHAGLTITLNKIKLSSVDFRFMLDPTENPVELLHSFKEPSPLLTSDSQSLVLLGGPYSFDGLTGQVEPKLETIHLPVAKYTGIMLSFKKGQQYDNEHQGQILMSGSFIYKGATQRIIVNINRTFSPFYKFAGGIFTLSPTDTTTIELRFDANQWFRNVDIAHAIDLGQLSFNQGGEIVINSWSSNCTALEFENTICWDFIRSGKLVLY
jgi:hypothetical protein